MSEIKYNLPQNREQFKGEFVVFFSDKENPEILFHSVVAEDAYKKAEEIFVKEGKRPTVTLIQDTVNNVAQLLAFA